MFSNLLFGLPADVTKHIIIGWIAEGAREYTGWELPRFETVIGYISYAVPLFAAIGTLYLYHKFYSAVALQKYQLVREQSKILDWKSYAAVIFFLMFIPSVSYGSYREKFRPVIREPTKYMELRQLPNPELRERAFAVAGKVRDLSTIYATRQSEINGQYNKDKGEFDRQNAEYEKAKAEYDTAKLSCSAGFSFTGTPL